MIKFASINDLDDIMQFIDTNWKKDHILAKDKFFFEYMHRECDETLSFIISRNNKNEIDAILGYIPYGRGNTIDIFLALWKSTNSNDTSLGLKLLNTLLINREHRILACVGINKKTIHIYKFLGWSVGQLTQWYRIRPKDAYHIAKINNNSIPEVKTNLQYPLLRLNSFEDLENFVEKKVYEDKSAKPYKEKWYIKKRYFGHPIYRYEVYGIKTEATKIPTIIVLRVEQKNNAQAIRFIDCIGQRNLLGTITTAIDKLLVKKNAEYIDLYEAGLEEDLLLTAGWLKVCDSGNIIPNYFNPFVQENIDILCCSTDPDVVFFKGDGDQDRPN